MVRQDCPQTACRCFDPLRGSAAGGRWLQTLNRVCRTCDLPLRRGRAIQLCLGEGDCILRGLGAGAVVRVFQ